jgi:peroxiredoxin
MKSLIIAAVLGLALALPAAGATQGEVMVGSTLRDATLQGLNGPVRKLSSYRGKPLVINVWASWCGPCRQEMGSLERLAWRDEARQFAVIGISTDDYPEAARGFLKKTNATFSHFIDSQLLLENMLGADHLPLTLLVDAQGRVLKKVYGATEWDSPESLAMIRKAFQLSKVAAAR